VISQGDVVLTAARRDCGLSSAGGMNIVEFSDRARKANPSLTDLRGTILCKSSKAVTGRFENNYNSGGRPNYSEANVFSLDGIHYSELSQSGSILKSVCQRYGAHDVMAGFSFCGACPPERGDLRYKWHFKDMVWHIWQLEVITWSDGPFQGTAGYEVSTIGDGEINETGTFWKSTNHPYITVIVQAFSSGAVASTKAEVETYEVWVEKP
jgi:hypothetical protein